MFCATISLDLSNASFCYWGNVMLEEVVKKEVVKKET